MCNKIAKLFKKFFYFGIAKLFLEKIDTLLFKSDLSDFKFESYILHM